MAGSGLSAQIINDTFDTSSSINAWTRADDNSATNANFKTWADDGNDDPGDLGGHMAVDHSVFSSEPGTAQGRMGISLERDLGQTVSVGSVGDSISVSLRFRNDVVEGGGFRIGFFDASGNGYWANLGTPPGATASGASVIQEQDDETQNPFESFTDVSGSSESIGLSNDSTDLQDINFSIVRTGSGLDLTASFTEANTGTDTTITGSDNSLSTTDFTRVIMTYGLPFQDKGPGYSVDDVSVIPEPGTVGLLLGAGALAAAGLRRRGRSG